MCCKCACASELMKKNASINKNEYVCEKFVTDFSVSSHV